jgi:hypothetical protein
MKFHAYRNDFTLFVLFEITLFAGIEFTHYGIARRTVNLNHTLTLQYACIIFIRALKWSVNKC